MMYMNKTDKELIQMMVGETEISKNNEIMVEFATRLLEPKHMDRVDIGSPTNLVNFLKMSIGTKSQEYFVAVYLNTNNQVLSYKDLFKGTLDRSVVHPREVFKEAILNSAKSVIITHNHPSGSLRPSDADLHTTEQLIEGGKLLGISVLDHLVITSEGYTSMRRDFSYLFD